MRISFLFLDSFKRKFIIGYRFNALDLPMGNIILFIKINVFINRPLDFIMFLYFYIIYKIFYI